jgi:hypothetical protein
MTTAVVHAAGRATSYRRTGAGAPVVVLLNDEPRALDRLARTLSSRYRVISTDVDVPSREFCSWLSSFLDGLGIHGAIVVTEPSRESDVLDFCARDMECVRQVFVMDDGPSVANLLGVETRVHRIPLHGAMADQASRVLQAIETGDGFPPD